MKIKIAICDDEKESLKNIRNKVLEISEKLNYDIEIFESNSGKEIVQCICEGKKAFDILLLDIDMPEISGLEVAKVIRSAGIHILLLFISAHEQYVYEAIEYMPFRYIRKYKMDIELFRALKAAYENVESNIEKTIVVKTDTYEKVINDADIMYFEIESRKLNVHLTGGETLIVNSTIKDLYSEVEHDRFIMLHRGCVVNAKYVNEFSNFDVTLENGVRLIVSRPRVKTVRSSMLKYLKGK